MNFFGMLGQIGRMLPGYVDGRRMAIADNWQDQSNYNQNLHGQMRNAFDIATFEPQMNNVWYNSALMKAAADQGIGNYNIWAQTYVPQLQNAASQYMQGIGFQNQLRQVVMEAVTNWLKTMQQGGQQPPVMQGQPKQPTTNPPDDFNQRLNP